LGRDDPLCRRYVKVVLAPFGTRGDIQPMVALGAGLRARGHDVLLTGPANFGPWVEECELAFAAVGGDFERQLKDAGDAASGLVYQTRFLVRELVPLQFEILPHLCADADLIVGAGVQFAARSVAEHLGKPYAFVAYAPVAVPSSHYPPPFVRNQRLPRWVNRLLWRTFGVTSQGLLGRAVTRGRATLGLPPVSDLVAHLSEVPLILAVEPELADPPPDLPAATRVTGPLLLRTDASLDGALERFLDAGAAPVFVGFGSMVSGSARPVVRLLARAARDIGCRMLVQAGWTGMRASDLDLPDGCMLIDAAPHDRLFPRVHAAIHHGGAGTTTAVARAGKPQLLLPHLLDQFFWAHRVRSLGLGPRGVPIHGARRLAQVSRLLVDLVGTERYAARARDLASRLGRIDGVGETVRILERLVAARV